jgi:hypothetical protein
VRRLLAVAIALGTASSAQAATVQVDHPCYLARQPGLESGQAIGFAGSGFAPGSTVTASLDGAPVASGPATPSGDFAGETAAPALPRNRFTGRSTLTLGDGASTASIAFPVTLLAADFSPSTGNPNTLKVRFRIYGFGPVLAALGRSSSARVYEHLFSPGGKRRATYFVGRTHGPCGSLVSARRRILPFFPLDGRWRFVFTTSRRYSASSAPLAATAFRVRTFVTGR